MNLVDSCGWLEFLAGTDRAVLFAPALADVRHLIVPTICVMEVSKILLRRHDRNAVATAVAVMRQGAVVDLDHTLAIDAAMLAIALRMPTVDSIVLATARRFEATVWTQDADFAGKPGVKFFPKAT